MEIIFKGKNFELTPSVEEYARKKLDSVENFLNYTDDDSVKAEIEIGRTTYHHRKGDVLFAEINLSVGGKLFRARSEQEDIFAALDEVRDNLEREIKKFKTKRGTIFLRGARSIKKKLNLSVLARFRK